MFDGLNLSIVTQKKAP